MSEKKLDDLVEIEIELDDELFMGLALEAHKRDITLNKLIEIILREMLDNYDVDKDVEEDTE